MSPRAAQIWDSEDGRSLQSFITEQKDWDSAEGQLQRISRPSGGSPFLVWITALINGTPESSYCAVSVYDPDTQKEVSRAVLLAAYRFTRAELRLVEQLLAGRTPIEAAQALGVTIHTVRTYLKRLYHKVGVRSQATLVRRLIHLSALIAPEVDEPPAA